MSSQSLVFVTAAIFPSASRTFRGVAFIIGEAKCGQIWKHGNSLFNVPFIQRRLYIGLGQEAFAYKKVPRPFSAVVVSLGGFSLHTAFSNLLLN